MNTFESTFSPTRKRLALCILGITAASAGFSGVYASEPVSFGSLSDFAVLSAAPLEGGAVTCTDSLIFGDVGSSGAPASVVQTNCYIDGTIIAPVSAQVLTDFNDLYDTVANQACDEYLTTLAGQTLEPGTYCFEAASTTTDGVLTLEGGSSDSWLFKIGTLGTGALTGTDFDVVLSGGASACNVTWWVAEAATITRGDVKGNILAGAAISMTGVAPTSPFEGRALATGEVTLTNLDFLGCEGDSGGDNGDDNGDDNGTERAKCNQGVGNGPEDCDPGNSNQGDPSRSNDELGGTPGNPGRKGGNR
ncbi:MAG: ice-binding family protein [Pseudomonadales bacterium]